MSFTLIRDTYRPPGRQPIAACASEGQIIPMAPIRHFILIEGYDIPSEGKSLTLPAETGYSLVLNSFYVFGCPKSVEIEVYMGGDKGGGDHILTLTPKTQGGAFDLPRAIVLPGNPVTIKHSRKGETIPYLHFTGEPCLILDTLRFE